MDNSNESRGLTRRSALRVLGAGVGVGASVVLAACKSEADNAATTKKAAAPQKAAPPKSAAAQSCDSLEAIDEKSKNMRKTLQYVEKSTKEGKSCSNCAQWEAGKYPNSKCGGCKLFSGPVDPAGNCLSYAPMKAG